MAFDDTFKLIGGIAGLIGGTAGIIALVWRGLDEFGSYLRISLEVDVSKKGWATIRSTADNKGFRPKKIEWAFLLIGPKDESPVDTANALEIPGSPPIRITNDLFLLKPLVSGAIRSGHRVLAPLPFYFSENVDIADETLAYRAAIDVSGFPVLTPFSVRLFIGGPPPRLIARRMNVSSSCLTIIQVVQSHDLSGAVCVVVKDHIPSTRAGR